MTDEQIKVHVRSRDLEGAMKHRDAVVLSITICVLEFLGLLLGLLRIQGFGTPRSKRRSARSALPTRCPAVAAVAVARRREQSVIVGKHPFLQPSSGAIEGLGGVPGALVHEKKDLVPSPSALHESTDAYSVSDGALKRVVVTSGGWFVDLMLPVDKGLEFGGASSFGAGDALSGRPAKRTHQVVPLEHPFVAAVADSMAAGKRKGVSSGDASAGRAAATRFGAVFGSSRTTRCRLNLVQTNRAIHVCFILWHPIFCAHTHTHARARVRRASTGEVEED